MDVAVLDTEKENTVPLQSPQLGQAHQGWIRGTPQVSLVALLPVRANYPCILRPPPSEPNPLNGNPHNPSSNNQCLATKRPYPQT